jgi:hypothetical protein
MFVEICFLNLLIHFKVLKGVNMCKALGSIPDMAKKEKILVLLVLLD